MIAAEKSLYFFKDIDALIVFYIVKKWDAITESMGVLIEEEKPLKILWFWEFIVEDQLKSLLEGLIE